MGEERHKSVRTISAKDLVPPLIIAALGVAGAVTFYFLAHAQVLEVIVLVLAVALIAIGYQQRLLRGVASLIILYVASGVAATFYSVATPYVAAPLGGELTRRNLSLSFLVLTAAGCAFLEFMTRASMKDVTLPALGILDNLGGMLLYVFVGILVATLIFNAVGYSEWGRYAHNHAVLRPVFRQVLSWHYALQTFWFRRPPPIYVYDLDLP